MIAGRLSPHSRRRSNQASQPTPILEVKHSLLGGPAKSFHCDLMALDCTPGVASAIVLYRMPRAISLYDIDMPEGSITLGYFWEDRPYNVYHWLDPDERTLAYYVNVADQTKISATCIEWRDLVLDLLIHPDGHVQVIDEDELPRDLPPPVARRIEAARLALVGQAARAAREIEQASRQWLSRR